jgi:hypothetical protein
MEIVSKQNNVTVANARATLLSCIRCYKKYLNFNGVANSIAIPNYFAIFALEARSRVQKETTS